MKKAWTGACNLLGKMLILGFGIQTVLGIVWMCLNFPGVQEFGESALYVQISKNFICDEYTGPLYPVFLLLAGQVEKFFGVPYYLPVYVVQAATAFLAGYVFLGQVTGRKESALQARLFRVFGSLALLTLPMAMQCHLAVLPNSFASSFFLLEICMGLQALNEKSLWGRRTLMKTALFWIACALLMPEYLYLGAAPMAFVSIYLFLRGFFGKKEHRKTFLRCCMAGAVCLAVSAGVVLGVLGMTREKGAYGKVQRSLEAAAVSRFAWSSLADTYESWPEEMRGAVDLGILQESAYYPDNMARLFGPAIEGAVGEDRAREYFLELAKLAWENNRNTILHEIAWDAAGYTVAPVALQMQLSGRGYDACSGRNYEIMRHDAPLFTKIYVDFGCWWFGVSLALTAILQVLVWGQGKRTVGLSALFVLFSCAGMIVWYTMQAAGLMDYKYTITVTILWAVWGLKVYQAC